MSKEEKKSIFKTDEVQEFIKSFYQKTPSNESRKKDSDMHLIKIDLFDCIIDNNMIYLKCINYLAMS